MKFSEKVRIAKKELPLYSAIVSYKKAKNELFRVSTINDIHNTPVTREMYDNQCVKERKMYWESRNIIMNYEDYNTLYIVLRFVQSLSPDDILDLIQWIELESINYIKGE